VSVVQFHPWPPSVKLSIPMTSVTAFAGGECQGNRRLIQGATLHNWGSRTTGPIGVPTALSADFADCRKTYPFQAFPDECSTSARTRQQ
jgi:hypothetical protein